MILPNECARRAATETTTIDSARLLVHMAAADSTHRSNRRGAGFARWCGRADHAQGAFVACEATRAIATLVRSDEQLRDLWIEGEVGRVTISTAGHAYFALKDEKSQLQCVWFRDERVRSAGARAGLAGPGS